MDSITRRILDVSEHNGNALLLLILIGHSIADKDRRPKLDDLIARFPGKKKLSRRQIERLESSLVESQELQIIEAGGRGKGNLYDIPAIRDLLDGQLQAEFAALDMSRVAAVLGDVPSNLSGKVESPPDMSGQQSPSEVAGISSESPSNPAGKAESPTHPTRIQSRVSLSNTDHINNREREESARETETAERPRRRRGRRAGTETPFPDDFQVTEEMAEWGARECPGLDLRFATASWADTAKAKGWLFVDWNAAWKNGMRMAFKWRTEDGTIKRPPAPAQGQPPAPKQSDADLDEYRRNQELMNQPCSECNPFGLEKTGNADCPNCKGSGREPLSKILAGMRE